MTLLSCVVLFSNKYKVKTDPSFMTTAIYANLLTNIFLFFLQLYVVPADEHGGMMRTQTCPATLNPRWHEIFTIPIRKQELRTAQMVLQVSSAMPICCMDHNAPSYK